LIDGEEFINKIAQYRIGVKEVITYEIDEGFFLKISWELERILVVRILKNIVLMSS
jgi:hypothetical protein